MGFIGDLFTGAQQHQQGGIDQNVANQDNAALNQLLQQITGITNQELGGLSGQGPLGQILKMYQNNQGFFKNERDHGLDPAARASAQTGFDIGNQREMANARQAYVPNQAGLIEDLNNQNLTGGVRLQTQLAGMDQGIREQGARDYQNSATTQGDFINGIYNSAMSPLEYMSQIYGQGASNATNAASQAYSNSNAAYGGAISNLVSTAAGAMTGGAAGPGGLGSYLGLMGGGGGGGGGGQQTSAAPGFPAPPPGGYGGYMPAPMQPMPTPAPYMGMGSGPGMMSGGPSNYGGLNQSPYAPGQWDPFGQYAG